LSHLTQLKLFFKKLYFIDSVSVNFLFNLSSTYYKQVAFEKALSTIDKAILLNVQYSRLHNLMGQILGKQGKFNDAVKSF
jgi:tetratricopeptide (TPR) repeat protein